MDAELVAVGEELLDGDVADTHAGWLGARLAGAGVRVRRSVCVGDDARAIADCVRAAAGRVATVIVTGGLGPTPDDRTREGLARAAGVPLRRDGRAELPQGAAALPNDAGSAPGIRLRVGDATCYALPGPPHEMRAMFDRAVLPDLLGTGAAAGTVVCRVLRTSGLGEAAVAEALAPLGRRLAAAGAPSLAFLAGAGEVRVKLTAHGADPAAAAAVIAPAEASVRAALGDAVYGTDGQSLEGVLLDRLAAAGATLACAESLTGGLLSARLTAVPGASRVMLGGVTAYATGAKSALLGVPAALLAEHGAVSAATATAMALGVRERFGAGYGLSLTGVAGPDRQEGKPVGTVFVGLAGPAGSAARELHLPGDRTGVRESAVTAALDLARRTVTVR